MSSNADSNKWAPKLVIVLQLATWCAVGLMLVRRGAICLRGKTDDRTNMTDGKIQTIAPPQYSKTADRTMSLSLLTPRVHRADSWSSRRTIEENEESSPSLGVGTRFPDDRIILNGSWQQINENRKRKTLAASAKSYARSIDDTSDIQAGDLIVGNDRRFHKEKKYRPAPAADPLLFPRNLEEGIGSRNRYSTMSAKRRRDEYEDNTVLPSRNKLRRKNSTEFSRAAQREEGNVTRVDETHDPGSPPRPIVERPVSRAGAAVAIAMLTIGIIMLLLGPIIVILRALDARRQRRRQRRRLGRCSRTSRDGKDLPPTYEQATLMDQAPRYSTLRLDALLEP